MSEAVARPAGSGPAPGRVIVPADELRRFTAAVFIARGMPAEQAETVAEVLVWANLRGVDTHGVTRLPRYVEMIDLGDMNVAATINVRDAGTGAIVIEADRAPGPVAMMQAVDGAVRCAGRSGIGIGVVRGTTHTAALGFYTRRAAERGHIAIALAASQPNMVYHGARAPGVSTAPLSIAVPGGPDGPIVLDFGSGIVSMGRLVQARRLAQNIPEGWALDRDGAPTTDGTRAHTAMPMAGPKGSGLALMIEIITSLLAGHPLIAETLEQTELGKRHRQNGALIAIDVARFVDPAVFNEQVQRLAADIKALPAAERDVDILLPGERGNRIEAARRADGIPLPPALMKELAGVATRLQIGDAYQRLAGAGRPA